jgi:hypothetical protein
MLTTLSPRVRRAALTAVVFLGAGACGGDAPTQSEDLLGRRTLEQVDGVGVPAPVFDDVVQDDSGSFHLRVVATSGWLELGANGRYDHGIELAATIDGQPAPTTHWRDHGMYTVRGDTVDFESAYLENVSFHARVADRRLHVDQDLVGEGRAAQFTFGR